MTGYLIDTNVVSELRKPQEKRNREVTKWASKVELENGYLSVLTIQELKTGILLLQRKDERQAKALQAWFNDNVMEHYYGRILPIDAKVALKTAELHVPDRRPAYDAFIAATALVHNLTLATRNIKDFIDTGVSLVNPWEPNLSYTTIDITN